MSDRFIFNEKERRTFGFVFYILCLVLLLIRYNANVLISQLNNPALVYPSADNTYWIFLLSGIPNFLVSNSFVSMAFDLILLASTVMCAINCNKREYALVFCVFIWIYFLTFNTYSAHHYHGLIGVLMLSIPFLSGKAKTFSYLMEMVRYYYLFFFASAALWKLFRGSVFHSGQLKATLMEQHVGYLAQNPDSFRADLVTYFISHQQAGDLIFILTFFLQLIFIIGFFTQKTDRWLFWIAVIFHLMNWMVMRIFSIELIVFNLMLLNWKTIFPLVDSLFRKKKPEPVVTG